MLVRDIFNDRSGSILFSVILGLGLAAVFRRVCHGDQCIVVHSPNMDEVRDSVYRVNPDECFRYTPEVIPCPLNQAAAKQSA